MKYDKKNNDNNKRSVRLKDINAGLNSNLGSSINDLNKTVPLVSLDTDLKSVINKIKVIISEQAAVEIEKVTYDAKLLDDLGCDSLDIVEVFMEIEKVFNINIPENEYNSNDITVRQVIDLVKSKISMLYSTDDNSVPIPENKNNKDINIPNDIKSIDISKYFYSNIPDELSYEITPITDCSLNITDCNFNASLSGKKLTFKDISAGGCNIKASGTKNFAISRLIWNARIPVFYSTDDNSVPNPVNKNNIDIVILNNFKGIDISKYFYYNMPDELSYEIIPLTDRNFNASLLGKKLTFNDIGTGGCNIKASGTKNFAISRLIWYARIPVLYFTKDSTVDNPIKYQDGERVDFIPKDVLNDVNIDISNYFYSNIPEYLTYEITPIPNIYFNASLSGNIITRNDKREGACYIRATGKLLNNIGSFGKLYWGGKKTLDDIPTNADNVLHLWLTPKSKHPDKKPDIIIDRKPNTIIDGVPTPELVDGPYEWAEVYAELADDLYNNNSIMKVLNKILNSDSSYLNSSNISYLYVTGKTVNGELSTFGTTSIITKQIIKKPGNERKFAFEARSESDINIRNNLASFGGTDRTQPDNTNGEYGWEESGFEYNSYWQNNNFYKTLPLKLYIEKIAVTPRQTYINNNSNPERDKFNFITSYPINIRKDYSNQDLTGQNLIDQDLTGAIFTNANLTYTNFKDVKLAGANLSGANLSNTILSNANLSGANLSDAKNIKTAILIGATFTSANLSGLDFSGVNLSNTNFSSANLSNTNFSNAIFTNTNLSNANLTNANLSGTNITYATFIGATLTGANLSGLDFSGRDFSNANLSNTNFSNAILTNTNLTNANLTNANLSGTNIKTANITGATLTGANLSGLDFSGRDFSNANLSNTNFSNAILTNTNLTNANLSGANLSGTNIKTANITGATLTGANLSGLDLSERNFSSANLSNTNFSNAILTNTNLSNANLTNANLSGVNLSGANLSNTNFSNATLTGINLSGANLSGRDFSGANLSGANLSNTNLTNTIFSGANLSNANLSNTNLSNTNFSGANLIGINLSNTNLSERNFSNINFSNANLSNINFSNVIFIGATFTSATLTGTILTGVNFTGATLTNANLTDANLTGARALTDSYNTPSGFINADFTKANFTNANLSGVDFINQNFTDAIFTKANLTNAKLQGAKLTGANLTEAVLNGTLLTGAAITGANLTNANLSNANLSNANLSNANLTGAKNIKDANVTGTTLTGANLTGLDFSERDFSGLNLSNTNFSGANLTKVNLSNANLSNANLSNANLSNAILTNTILTGATFIGINLSNTNLLGSNTNLLGRDFSNTNFSGANLTGADFSNTNFTGANVSGTNFTGATLINVKFTNANLTNANLTSSQFLDVETTGANLTGATFFGTFFYTIDFNSIILSNEVTVTGINSDAGQQFTGPDKIDKISIRTGYNSVNTITINGTTYGDEWSGNQSSELQLTETNYINEIAYSFDRTGGFGFCEYLEFKTSNGDIIKAGNMSTFGPSIRRLKNIKLVKISGKTYSGYLSNLTFTFIKL